MKRIHWQKLLIGILAFSFASLPLFAAPAGATSDEEVSNQVRHDVQSLPYYGVSDLIWFHVKDGVVTVGGEVYRASLKDETDEEIRKIPGVRKLIDRIDVLPVSPSDDHLRWKVFRRIYTDDFLARYGNAGGGLPGAPFLSRYFWGRGFHWFALGMEPIGEYAIHIIVRHGKVTLYGVVATEADRVKAGLDARGVFGVMKVDNRIEIAATK
jgi:BON domain